MEVIAFVRTYRNETCTHSEAVEIASDVTVHIGYLVCVEVIRGRKREVPVLCGLYVA